MEYRYYQKQQRMDSLLIQLLPKELKQQEQRLLRLGSFGDAMAIRLQLNGVNIPNSEAYGTSAPGVTASNPATNTMLIVVTVTNSTLSMFNISGATIQANLHNITTNLTILTLA